MRIGLGLLFLLPLAGCTAPQDHHLGSCEPVSPLLVMSWAVNMADPPTPTWTIVWPDGRTETWIVEATLRAGPAEESTVVTDGAPDAQTACGVAASHGAYPGPHWPPTGFPEGTWQMHLRVTREEVASLDPAPVESAVRRSFFSLPRDASMPQCADGTTLAFSAQVDGRTHRSQASCQGIPDFEEFAAFVRTWLGGAR